MKKLFVAGLGVVVVLLACVVARASNLEIPLIVWFAIFHWFCQSFLNRPSGPQSHTYIPVSNTKKYGPLRYCFGLSIKRYSCAFLLVIVLFLNGGPLAIVGLITLIVIESLYGISFRARPHIGKEVVKGLFPAFANSYSTVIVNMFFIFGIRLASLFHASPSFILGRKNLFNSSTMLVRCQKLHLIAVAPTRDYVAVGYLVLLCKRFFSTVTPATPHRISPFIHMAKRKHQQAIVFLSSNINSFMHSGKNVSILVCLSILMMAVPYSAFCGDVNPGVSFVDGQKLTAAQLNALVGQATILPSFFTGQVAAPSNLQSSDIILTVNGSGSFRKMTGSQVISTAAFFTNSAISTNFQPYSYLIYWNPSNTTVFQISGTAFGYAESSNMVPTNFPMATTNGNNLPPYTNTPSASNTTYQVLFPVYDTNGGILYSLTFSNLVAASASQLGSNNLVPWIYTNTFVPWLITKIQPTNFWLFPTNFAITNLQMTNTNGVVITNRTLVDADTIPVNSGPQGTNTTVTMATVQQYIQTNNAILQGSFSLTNVAILAASSGFVTNVAHNLGSTPRFVTWNLLCVTNDQSYVVGDHVAVFNFVDTDQNNVPAFAPGQNATNVFLTEQSTAAGISIMIKGTGTYGGITFNRWKAEVFAVP